MPIRLTDAAQYYQGLPHQTEAWEELQRKLESDTDTAYWLHMFAIRYRNENATFSHGEKKTYQSLYRALIEFISTIPDGGVRASNFREYGEEILKAMDEEGLGFEHLGTAAYILATASHESHFAPVVEAYYMREPRRTRYLKSLWYYPYIGHGHVQVTHKGNWMRVRSEWHELRGEWVIDEDIPEMLLRADVSAFSLVRGMCRGWYGQRVGRFTDQKNPDYFNARKSVNAPEINTRPQVVRNIAGYAKEYEEVIANALK